MTDTQSLNLYVRDAMFAERTGIDGWRPADAAIRTGDWASLEELVGELKSAGLSVHPTIFASGTFASPMAEVLLGGASGLTALAAVLRAWFHRHDGKKINFEFNDRRIDLEGMTEGQITDVLRSLSNFSSELAESDEKSDDQD